MGVVTVCDIDYGQIYGPFPTNLTSVDMTYVIGMLTTDKSSQGPFLHVDPTVHNGGARALDWLPYIKPARNEEEQNIEAYMKAGQVFYRTLRIIKAGEELLVWYSKDFCQLINIPDIKRKSFEEDGSYVCTYCGDTFEHIFPLRAHMRFKCDINGNQQKVPLSTSSDIAATNSNMYSTDSQNYNDLKYASSSVISESERHTQRKRHLSDKDTVITKKAFVYDSISPVYKESQSKDYNSNIKSYTSNLNTESLSAFRKVEKTNSPQEKISPNTSHSPERNSDNDGSISSYKQSVLPAYEKQQNNLSSVILPPLTNNGHMIMSNSLLPGAFLDPQTRASIMEVYKTNFANPYSRLQESMLRKIEGLAPEQNKHFIYADRVNSSVPFMKCSNPIVDKIVCNNTNPTLINSPATAMNLSQNWCAKCNATFRMTSDLVYHMRSHHKREFDPAKRKRDEKLRCDICHETFRERHHLTRHMTSHA